MSLKEHAKWFSSLQKNKKFNTFIIYYNSKKIGYIRTLKSKENNLISIALGKKYRNKGIGSRSMSIFEKRKKLKNLTAHVLKKNYKSLNFFFSCNFFIESESKNIFIMKKKNK